MHHCTMNIHWIVAQSFINEADLTTRGYRGSAVLTLSYLLFVHPPPFKYSIQMKYIYTTKLGNFSNQNRNPSPYYRMHWLMYQRTMSKQFSNIISTRTIFIAKTDTVKFDMKRTLAKIRSNSYCIMLVT